jgi:hypothetical protein
MTAPTCPDCGRPPGFSADNKCYAEQTRRELGTCGPLLDCERAGRLAALATIEAMTAEVAEWAEEGDIPFVTEVPDDDGSYLPFARMWAESKRPKV